MHLGYFNLTKLIISINFPTFGILYELRRGPIYLIITNILSSNLDSNFPIRIISFSVNRDLGNVLCITIVSINKILYKFSKTDNFRTTEL